MLAGEEPFSSDKYGCLCGSLWLNIVPLLEAGKVAAEERIFLYCSQFMVKSLSVNNKINLSPCLLYFYILALTLANI